MIALYSPVMANISWPWVLSCGIVVCILNEVILRILWWVATA